MSWEKSSMCSLCMCIVSDSEGQSLFLGGGGGVGGG